MIEMLGEVLFNLRREKGCTQKEVAQYAGITPAALSAYEKGTKTPQLETAVKLAEYYGITLDALCGRQVNTAERNIAFTKADAIRLTSLLYENVPYVSIENEENTDGDFNSYYNTVITIHAGSDAWAYAYFEKYVALARLYRSGDIDKEVLEAWKEKKLQGQTYQETFHKQEEAIQVDDGELPF